MKCLYPPCKQEARSRGLCHGHGGYARALVKEKKTTWAELEKLGKAAKPTPRYSPIIAWFMSQEGLPREKTDGNAGIK